MRPSNRQNIGYISFFLAIGMLLGIIIASKLLVILMIVILLLLGYFCICC